MRESFGGRWIHLAHRNIVKREESVGEVIVSEFVASLLVLFLLNVS
ncbi:MAG TPA: hypothetical protein VJ441_02040 [Dehalococcoidia bacterium]|nr:hypothetical protein [Dehalococcoidia bacterium]